MTDETPDPKKEGLMERKLQIRCSDEQKQAWTRAAGGEGSLSEWMRATLDRQARITIPVVVDENVPSHTAVLTNLDKVVEEAAQDPVPLTSSDADGRVVWEGYEPGPDDDTSPEPEEPMPRIELPVPRPLAVPPVVPPQVIEPQYTLPSPTCRNAVYHWKLTAGEACTFCGGRA